MKHDHHSPEHSCCHVEGTPWYKEKLTIVFFVSVVALIISYFVSFLNPFFDTYTEYLSLIWWALLLGLIISGIIEYFVPQEYITKYLSRSHKKAILYAVGFGFLMSVCSHGILAIAIQLYKKGASIPCVITFLLASPWANVPITLLLFSFFGIKAIFIIIAALIIAVITGFLYQLLERMNFIEKSNPVEVDNHFSIIKDIKKRYKNYVFSSAQLGKDVKGVFKGTVGISKMVLWWILLGTLLAAATGAFIPAHIFEQYMGPTILGLIITLIVATIIEVCSEGSSPIAFELYRQTGALGNSFTFLTAGVATDYTEIGLLWSNIGKKTALWLPVITVPQILVFAWFFNVFL